MVNRLKGLFNLDFEFDPNRNDSGSDNILMRKANQLHEILLYISLFYSLVFTALNVYNGHQVLALLTFIVFPFTIISYVLFRSGYVLISKVWNIVQLNFIISALAINTTQGGGVIVFFIPILVGTLIAFQGHERFYGYVLSTLILILSVTLLATDVGLPDSAFEPESVKQERLLNLSSAFIATILEVVFILRLSDNFQDKLVEKSIELNKKNIDLIKANGELDNFVYRVSHDLRSPLLSVKGLLALVFQNPKLDEKNEGYLRRAESSIIRLDETIQEILEYSRNSRLTQKIETFDIRRMIELIFEDLRQLAGPNFNFKLEMNGPNEILSDGYRVNTVMRNLISNSVKYQKRDIPNPELKVVVKHLPKKIEIQVIDNGEGIPTSSLPRVFEMFFRGTNSTVGTGLGLYICKEVIEKLDGTINIDSTPGEGTSVFIELPIKPIKKYG